jgi:hypothetical protein
MYRGECVKYLISFFIILFLISGCSNNTSFELLKSSVEVGDGGAIGVLDGEKTVRTLEFKNLTYNFVIKNTGNRPIGGMTTDTMINAKIVPKRELIELSEAIMGINLFDDEQRVGEGGTPILEPNEEGKFSFSFSLGAKENYQENMRVAPSQELIDKIKENAFNATLHLFVGDKEVASYDLTKFN